MSASAPLYDLHLAHSHEALKQLPEPKQVFKHLLMCLETPRPSNKEGSLKELELITNKLLAFGKAHGLDGAVDEIGNVRLRKAATAGYENATKIVLQSHMDVVCSKSNDKVHDFEKDPVTPIVDLAAGVLRADRTTLGADDGIGVAASMAILEIADPAFVHGPLEAVFTVDEETTMQGVERIAKAPFLQSEVLINVDSEEAHSICVGCAGGFEKKLFFPVSRTAIPADGKKKGFKLHLHSLLGGHTGIDIHKGRANALQIIARLLLPLFAPSFGFDMQLLSLEGGNAPNAIPRDATVEVAVNADKVDAFPAEVKKIFTRIQKEFEFIERRAKKDNPEAFESSMYMDVTVFDAAGRAAVTAEKSEAVTGIMVNLPHGPLKINVDLDHAVDTSISFSIVSLPAAPPAGKVDEVLLHLFSRSSFDLDMRDVDLRLNALAKLTGCTVTETFNYFPGWDPKLDSPALKQVIATHQALFNSQPRVYSVHAGLECGLFKLAYPNLDCVSIGPTIHHAHSPQEELVLNTVEPFFKWLKESISNISKASIGKQ